MLRTLLALAALAAAAAAQAASSSAVFGTPTFTLTDLDPNDGIAPVFRLRQPGDESWAQNVTDFNFMGALQPSVLMTTGAATVSARHDASGMLQEFGGSTSGPLASYGFYDTGSSDLYYLSPHTQLTATFPFTISYDVRGGGSAAASADVMAQLLAGGAPRSQAPEVDQSPGGSVFHDSQVEKLTLGHFVEQVVLTFKNTSAHGGAMGYMVNLFANGASAAQGCMRSHFH